ncbi:facilitated trehalose transporter Tret1-like [Lycorma delicatula]|uniref:facilitated trehalose transporter Tret1-like n=1 Tax=Lycorma delicatula TaxID=130591 RepID=UPI003F50EFAE
MTYIQVKEVKSCKQLIIKHIAPVSVLLLSLVLGTIVGWPIINLPTLLSSNSPIKLTKEEISWMMVLLFFGNMISPIPTGYLMDKYGRKSTLMYLSVLPIISWLLIGIGNNAYEFWLSWFLAGLWSGVVYTVVPVYLGEITDPRYRGFINTVFSVVRRIGIVIQFVSGKYIRYNYLALIIIIIPLLFIILFIWAPESPYYYLMKNNKQDAKRELCKLRGKTEDKKEIENELNEMELYVNEEMKNRGRFKDLIATKASRKALFMMETIIILLRISETGSIMGYITATLPKKIFHFLDASQCVMIIETVRLITGLISAILIDAIGRRILMTTASITCGISMLLSGVWYFLNTNSNLDVTDINWIPFLCLVIHNMSYCLGLGPVCSSLRSEYFPMNIKSKSTAITSTTLALVSCIINKTFLTTADSVGLYLNYLIFSISCFVNAIFTLFFVIETKGKTLKEIQDELNGNNNRNVRTHVQQNV